MTSESPTLRLPAPPRVDLKWFVIGASVALAAWLALVPVAFLLLWQSFLTPETAAAPAQFTWENYGTAYFNAETVRLFGNSVAFGVGSSSVAFVTGTFFAWINERTNTPFKSLFFALSLIPLVIPAILFTVSWILLASPKIGIVNFALRELFATDAVFVDIYSMGGMIFVDGMHQSPLAFLLMTAAFRAMDPSLEESALMSGATVLQIARRVTLRLAWPAALAAFLILFVRAVESFEVPALLGLPVGIEVYTSSIYQAIQRYPSEGRSRFRLRRHVAPDRVPVHLRAVARRRRSREILHRDRQRVPAAPDRHRGMALSHRGDLRRLFHHHRGAALPGIGLVFPAEILQPLRRFRR